MSTLQDIANKIVEIGLVGNIDPIRSIKGKYRTLDENNNFINFQTEDLISRLFEVNIGPAIDTSTYPSFLNNNFNLKVKKEDIVITFNNSTISEFLRSIGIEIITTTLLNNFKEKLQIAIIDKITTTTFNLLKPYEEYSFDYKSPYSLSEQQNYNFGLCDFYDVTTEYNFYEEVYENSLEFVNEKIIPNMYLTQQTGAFALDHTRLRPSTGGLDGVDNYYIESGYYFKEWSRQIFSYIQDNDVQYNKTINQANYFGINDDFSLLADLNNKRENFPFFNKVNFTTDSGQVGINTLIYDSNINCSFINTCLKDGINTVLTFGNGALGGEIEKSINVIQQSNVTTDENNNPSIEYSYVKSDFTGLELDFVNILSSSVYDGTRPTIPLNVFDTIEQVPLISYFDQCNDSNTSSITKTITYTLLKLKISELANSSFRTYKKIYNGDLCENETVIYTVRKLISGVPLQSIIFMNPLEVKNFIYYDTQIKYNLNYTYEIDAYQIVVGTDYVFDEYAFDTNSINLTCYTKPTLKIIQTKYFNKDIFVSDTPPLPLDIKFVPYFGINNKISFYMNSQVGKTIEEPIKIFEQDQQFIDNARNAQNKLNGPILFESDGEASVFQILRLEEKPTSYSDFVNSDITNISSLSDATSNSYLAEIEPNKYYYYTFRTIDVHGLLSNPTAVFELRIVDDSGTVYPEISVLNEFGTKLTKDPYKNFKKYLHIEPAKVQTIINTGEEIDSANNISNITLGLSEDTVWDKKFKLRIRSKSTGKIIDFDVTFLKNKI
jgi:hypothetical protein